MAIRSLFNLVPWATWAWTSQAWHQKDGMCSRQARSLDIVLYPCSVLLISPTHLDKWSNNAMCVWAHVSNCTDPRWLITILGNSTGSCFVYNDTWTAHTLGHTTTCVWAQAWNCTDWRLLITVFENSTGTWKFTCFHYSGTWTNRGLV